MKEVLKRCADITRDQKIPMIAMVIPDRTDAIPEQAPHPKIFPNYDRRFLSRTLTHCAQEAGILTYNLFPVFQAANPEELYFDYNLHWNAAGQAEAAKFMSTKILEFLKRDSSSPQGTQQRGPVAIEEKTETLIR